MPNRHDRRASRSTARRSRIEVRPMTEELRAGLLQQIRDPKFVRDIERFAVEMQVWAGQHPEESPQWVDLTGVSILGAPLDSEAARGYIAGNAAAHRCLIWADERTGKSQTVQMAFYALVVLGWVKR